MNKMPLGEVEPSATLDGDKTTHLGAAMIFANSLPGFKAFLGEAADGCADVGHVVAFVACVLLPAVARRSVHAAGRAIRSELRDAGNLLRFLGGSNSPSVLLRAAQQRLLDDAFQRDKRLHLLLVDSTQHGHQGQHCENSYSCRNTTRRPTKSSRKQKKTHKKSCHCFVFGLLLCPDGTRIPYWLPFHTKEYCQLRGWKHQTQADLAAQLVSNLPLADGIPVMVVGDTAFEAKQIRRACAKRGYHWVAPLNPERVLAGTDAKARPRVLSLVGHLKAQDFQRTSFRLDQGELAAMARVSSHRVRSSKHQRVYWVHRRTADVHSVGEVVLLFSNQKGPEATAVGVLVQKVLMSDATEASTEQLLRCYALRWQIELFFKEMKSQLGMCQYQVRDFQRVQGWVSLCVLAFCYLEHRRRELLAAGGERERAYWQAARTQAMRSRLRQEVEREDLLEILRQAKDRAGRKRLTALFAAGYDDPTHPRGRRKAS
jgi:Transposase DDE domain